MLRPVFFFIVFSFVSVQMMGQYGVRAKYNLNTFNGFDEYVDSKVNGAQEKLFANTIGFGVDYWFRLKKYRIEFLPEIHMGLKSTTLIGSSTLPSSSSFSYIGFNFNTQLYLFDLEGDCDCPTFSKQGPSLNKGLFLNVSPGVLYNSRELITPIASAPWSSSHINFKIGIGVGYDIGISDLFTITPMISYNIVPNVLFNDLANIDNTPLDEPDVISSGMSQLQFQVRVGFRPDYVKSYRRR